MPLTIFVAYHSDTGEAYKYCFVHIYTATFVSRKQLLLCSLISRATVVSANASVPPSLVRYETVICTSGLILLAIKRTRKFKLREDNNPLTPTVAIYGYCYKVSCARPGSSFVIFDIRALWHSTA